MLLFLLAGEKDCGEGSESLEGRGADRMRLRRLELAGCLDPVDTQTHRHTIGKRIRNILHIEKIKSVSYIKEHRRYLDARR